MFKRSDSAVTSMVWLEEPSSSTTFEVPGEFTNNCKFLISDLRKPAASTVSTYVPGEMVENSYSPAAVVLDSLTKPFSMLLRVTLASPTVAPDLSVTTPCSEVVPVWPQADAATRAKKTKLAMRFRFTNENQFMNCSFPEQFFKLILAIRTAGGLARADR